MEPGAQRCPTCGAPLDPERAGVVTANAAGPERADGADAKSPFGRRLVIVLFFCLALAVGAALVGVPVVFQRGGNGEQFGYVVVLGIMLLVLARIRHKLLGIAVAGPCALLLLIKPWAHPLRRESYDGILSTLPPTTDLALFHYELPGAILLGLVGLVALSLTRADLRPARFSLYALIPITIGATCASVHYLQPTQAEHLAEHSPRARELLTVLREATAVDATLRPTSPLEPAPCRVQDGKWRSNVQFVPLELLIGPDEPLSRLSFSSDRLCLALRFAQREVHEPPTSYHQPVSTYFVERCCGAIATPYVCVYARRSGEVSVWLIDARSEELIVRGSATYDEAIRYGEAERATLALLAELTGEEFRD